MNSGFSGGGLFPTFALHFFFQMILPKSVSMKKKLIHNFNAGPSVIPREVMDEASRAVMDFNNSGLSILEIGHRSDMFQEVMDEARALMKELMHLDNDHEVLFLHGGASTQFMQVPMNLLDENDTAAYTDTGLWASKAIKEAALFGRVEVVCSSADKKYSYLPKNFSVPPGARYLHITTNNTVYGTQWQDLELFRRFGVPLVADMSSDILSREVDFNMFDLMYAGAQKNAGAAGVNIVIVNKNILGKTKRKIPTIMDYRQHLEAGSLLNTPPVFAVYVSLLTLRWLKKMGGIAEIEKQNTAKAKLFYDTLDALPLFRGTVAKEDRSKMNAVFFMENAALENEFLELCRKEGMVGVKGHRSAGGFRVSMYNALGMESVKAITGLMKEFANKKG
jgi:phosphoserine aminotransferase